MGSAGQGGQGVGERLPRGSHGLPPEFVVHSQRERLFAGMARVVAQRGYAAATVDLIAAESGVSRKALYTHFTGKDDLLLEAHRSLSRRIAAGAGPSIAEQSTWDSRLRALLDWSLELCAREPELASLALVAMSAATPSARTLLQETLEPVRRVFEQARAESPNPVPEVAIDGMVGGAMHAIARAMESRDEAALAALPGELMAWFMLVFAGPAAAPPAPVSG
jgi:AcrR family transcriptional regulator